MAVSFFAPNLRECLTGSGLAEIPHQVRLTGRKDHRLPGGLPQAPEVRVLHGEVIVLLKFRQRIELGQDRNPARATRHGRPDIKKMNKDLKGYIVN